MGNGTIGTLNPEIRNTVTETIIVGNAVETGRVVAVEDHQNCVTIRRGGTFTEMILKEKSSIRGGKNCRRKLEGIGRETAGILEIVLNLRKLVDR